jgi:hypothetical protein
MFILTTLFINLLPHSAVYQDISQYEIITDVADVSKETTKIKLLLQKTVNKLDVEAHTVELDDGSVIEYNKVMASSWQKGCPPEDIFRRIYINGYGFLGFVGHWRLTQALAQSIQREERHYFPNC